MKWTIPCALMAFLGASLAHSPLFGAMLFPFYILAWKRYTPGRLHLAGFIICALLFFCITAAEIRGLKTTLSGEETDLPLRITEPVIDKGQTARAQAITLNGERLQISFILPSEITPSELSALSPSWCTWKGTLKSPSPARNPHLFNYQAYLKQQNIHWTFQIKELNPAGPCYEVLLTPREKIRFMRQRGIEHLQKIFPHDLAPLAEALIFGSRENMDEDLLEAYQKIGVIHLLAISGMHVGMMTAIMWWLLLRAGLTREKARVIILIGLPFYALITGASPPVIRAVSMVLIVLLFSFFTRKTPLLQALSVTFIIQLAINPMNLLQVGFQLSYAVSLTILLSAPRILAAASSMLSIVKVSFAAQIGAMPILLYHFHELSIASFIVNVFYIPVFTAVLLPILFFLYLVSFAVPQFASLVLHWAGEGVVFLDLLTLHLASLPFASIVLGQPSPYFMFLYICLTLFFFYRIEISNSVKPFIFLILLLSMDWLSSRFNPTGTVLFVDVGQGDSILIDLPWGQGTYLIDTGGAAQFENTDFSTGKDILWPVLKGKGITSVDTIILTHGDWDHIGGTSDLADYIAINEVWITPGAYEKDEVKVLLEDLHKRSIGVVEKKAHQSWEKGGNQFEIIYPVDSVYEGNNDSLVLWASIGGLTWFFAGDLETQGELDIIDLYSIHADVLKVGHHGSKSSTADEFLAELDPEFAIISAGVNNRYNHPHDEVTERLKARRIKVFGTHTHGAVEYRFRGKKGTFQWVLPYDEE
ncbi:DNA internalization-related competence protein ComEC/Rec2 [Jeotgalibacillus sp. ET6]|uniref:DNA internalization-related competence protein ComEC/Rec2 n=1 Tax=Jeotgalibacillus sp. ET6 TaxID=3037260 RepID=UPI002418AD04|nr:DNA internalization-related competence protein ComEC/Rec2 [Jeotgalibacillus sp. ET6]MDG5470874.1 DNA internalization-related competence protein ComEC/Rec2 [Jeotgalibacillus sp. ET6]